MNELVCKMDSPKYNRCLIGFSVAMMVLCNLQLCRANDAAIQNAPSQGEPVVCILKVAEVKNANTKNAYSQEDMTIFRLSQFHLSKQHHKDSLGASMLGNDDFKPLFIRICLYKKEDDPNNKGSLLLKFEVECNNKLYPIPEISWNQKDDLLLWSGGNSIVFLSTNNKVLPPDNLIEKKYHKFKF